jgi:hypothetical protein
VGSDTYDIEIDGKQFKTIVEEKEKKSFSIQEWSANERQF